LLLNSFLFSSTFFLSFFSVPFSSSSIHSFLLSQIPSPFLHSSIPSFFYSSLLSSFIIRYVFPSFLYPFNLSLLPSFLT
jgi:hypothetical protein